MTFGQRRSNISGWDSPIGFCAGLMLGVFRFEQLPENAMGKTPRQIPPLVLLQDGDLVSRLSQLKEIL